ncbi:MAG: hypothetical protein RR312_08645 [Bacteroidales bacterium]
MDITSDFSDVDSFFEQEENLVRNKVYEIGQEAIDYAKENGSYKDQTGTLRQSNIHEVDNEGLVLKNEAEYASYVESKGYEVLSSAALHAEKQLKEEFE